MNCPVPKGEIMQVNDREMACLDLLLLDPNGRLKLLPVEDYAQIPYTQLRIWANVRGRYGLPTTELILWLKGKIAGRSALEIGAGNGDLGHHLGIPMTDSYQQVDDPATVAHFATYGITPTRPPEDVKKEDAENAVRRRRPQVVIASYVTEKFMPRAGDPFAVGNYKGVRYDYIIERCEMFILIGNEKVHGTNRALSLPHVKHTFPWLVTRSEKPELNRIWVWETRRK